MTASASASGSTRRERPDAARPGRPRGDARRRRPDGDGAAVAVCLLFAYLNPDHELRVRDAIHARLPGLPVSLSHEVAPIWREYERGTTVTVDAFTKPLFDSYVNGLSQALEDAGVDATWSLLKSNGGARAASEALSRPAHLLLSGIAGGGIGGAYVARSAGVVSRVGLRHGRDQLRRLPRARRRAALLVRLRGRVRLSGQRSQCLHADDRRRRRIDRMGRPRWVPPGRPAERRRVAGSRLLRRGWGGGDDHRCEPGARSARSVFFLGGRLQLDPSLRWGARSARGAARTQRPGDCVGDGARLQREHGERDPDPDRRAGDGSARAGANCVRRGRPDARVRDRGRARHQPGPRTAGARAVLRFRRARGRPPDRRRPQRLPDGCAHDCCGGRLDLCRARGAGARRVRAAGYGGGADHPASRLHALPGTELRAGGAVPRRRDRSRCSPGRVRPLRAAVQRVLRLSPRRHPHRARPAGRDCDGRGTGLRPPARCAGRRRGRVVES